MEINLNDWDELASYYDNPTPPGLIYKNGKLLGFGLSDGLYLDKHGNWHCTGDWELYPEVINSMQAMADTNDKAKELASELVDGRLTISDDGDLSIRMNDDHTGWIVDESTDPLCHGHLSKRALQLMLEMLDDE